jgi:hypothetical protein
MPTSAAELQPYTGERNIKSGQSLLNCDDVFYVARIRLELRLSRSTINSGLRQPG